MELGQNDIRKPAHLEQQFQTETVKTISDRSHIFRFRQKRFSPVSNRNTTDPFQTETTYQHWNIKCVNFQAFEILMIR